MEGISRRKFIACSTAAIAGMIGYGATGYFTSPAFTLQNIPGVKEVYKTSGRHPDVIYVACPHPQQFGDANYSVSVQHLPHLKSIAESLVTDYGVNSIIIDSIMPQKTNGRYHVPHQKGDCNTEAYYSTLDAILGLKDWKVFDSERMDLTSKISREMDPILDLHEMFVDELLSAYNRLVDENKEKCATNEGRKSVSALADSLYSEIKSDYERKIDAVLDNAKLEALYDLIVVQRENIVAETGVRCKEQGIGPLFAIYGPGHSLSLPKVLDHHGLDYVCIAPIGTGFVPQDLGNLGMRSLGKLPPKRPGIVIDDFKVDGRPLVVMKGDSVCLA